ncbi:DUF1292 domain-containing protein [Metabacillus halosaccharovorans]|uniref:DUF1292 domain-containing protein n=1 Tax=Metabacillus TaxID=2675233 RepID=UPI001C1F3E7D|nr:MULTISPECIES: DUF1292 domain-containing protein [Metabacillus]MBU7593045.1 DUF1292 domain-containing protein [Metabacillus halosaccharovorans]MCM3442300.1 DUF1292 domain-containing protein [Metabacillus halosaccharovorans]
MDKIEVGEIFSITDENNEENEVEVLAAITIEGTDYVAVGFVDDIRDETDEDIDVFFMKLDQEGDLAPIESDEEFEKISSVFDDILDEEE